MLAYAIRMRPYLKNGSFPTIVYDEPTRVEWKSWEFFVENQGKLYKTEEGNEICNTFILGTLVVTSLAVYMIRPIILVKGEMIIISYHFLVHILIL